MKRNIVLLDNLGTESSVGSHQERLIDDIRYSTTQKHKERHNRRSTNLPPQPESPRSFITQYEDDYRERRESSRHKMGNMLTVLKETSLTHFRAYTFT